MQETRELQILKQVLGEHLGTLVHGLNLLAGSVGQMAEQVQEHQQRIAALEAGAPAGTAAPAPTENPWTGPETEMAP